MSAPVPDPVPPPGIDVTVSSVARMYDYYLGGKDNFAVDREAAEKVATAAPEVSAAARQNRAFLGRAVRYLAEEVGIRQFLDIGTGLPTQENVHQVAQRVAPDARVVYVDNDPIVLAHGRALLVDNDATTVVQADMRDPETILAHPEVTALIDFDKPVAVLFVSVLNFLIDADDPVGVVRRFREAMAHGSYLVISHATGEGRRAEDLEQLNRVYDQSTSALALRSREQILRFFDGFELVEPGLVFLPQWRPDASDTADDPEKMWLFAGVGRKP